MRKMRSCQFSSVCCEHKVGADHQNEANHQDEQMVQIVSVESSMGHAKDDIQLYEVSQYRVCY